MSKGWVCCFALCAFYSLINENQTMEGSSKLKSDLLGFFMDRGLTYACDKTAINIHKNSDFSTLDFDLTESGLSSHLLDKNTLLCTLELTVI